MLAYFGNKGVVDQLAPVLGEWASKIILNFALSRGKRSGVKGVIV